MEVVRETTIQVQTDREFKVQLDECKEDFKESVEEVVTTIKFKDAFHLKEDLNNIQKEKERRIDEIKGETRTLENDIFILNNENERVLQLIGEVVLKKHQKLVMRPLFEAWTSKFYKRKMQQKLNEDAMKKFRERNICKTAMRCWKRYNFSLGKYYFEGRLKDRIQGDVDQEAKEKTVKIQVMEELIRELEEQKSLEINAKHILKHKLDQVNLRGASSMQMEALRASQSTLNCKFSSSNLQRSMLVLRCQHMMVRIFLLRSI